MTVQFGFVTMFSVVWPWAGLVAFINNQLELRGDAFKLCFGSRRPVPRRTKGIGEWETPLQVQMFISVLAVAGLIAFGTGELESFMDECRLRGTITMTPDFTCLDDNAFRMFVLFALQNFAFCMIWMLLHWVDEQPSWVTLAMREDDGRSSTKLMQPVHGGGGGAGSGRGSRRGGTGRGKGRRPGRRKGGRGGSSDEFAGGMELQQRHARGKGKGKGKT